jgi:hypothetical protein
MEHSRIPKVALGIPTKRQRRQRSTNNKVERSTASPRSSFHGTVPRCPISVFVHDDDDDDDDNGDVYFKPNGYTPDSH